jgi:hypothetical protein
MAGHDLTELSSRRLADFVNNQEKTGETTSPDRLLRFNGTYGRGRGGCPRAARIRRAGCRTAPRRPALSRAAASGQMREQVGDRVQDQRGARQPGRQGNGLEVGAGRIARQYARDQARAGPQAALDVGGGIADDRE